MAKVFRPSTREASIISKIESGKERARRRAISTIRDCVEALSNALAMKLVEAGLIETNNKNSLEEQIQRTLEQLTRADDFEIDYQIAPIRNLIPNPHIVSLYMTSTVIEKLIHHKDIVDVFGSDEDIYRCIHQQVAKFLP